MKLVSVPQSIVLRLIVLAVAVTLAASTVFYFSLIGFMRHDIEELVTKQLAALARDMARDIDYKIDQRGVTVAQLAKRLPPDLLADPRALGQWLALRYDINPLFSHGFLVFDLKGSVIGAHAVPGDTEGRVSAQNFADRDYFKGAADGKLTIGSPIVGRRTGQPILPIAAPIRGKEGEVVAVLAGITGLDAPGFIDQIRDGHIGETGGYLLIDPKLSIYVAATIEELTFKPVPKPGTNLMHDRAMAGFRGIGIAHGSNGAESFCAIASVPSTGWFLVARLPTAEALALMRHTRLHVQQAAVAITCGIIFLLLVVLTWMFRPLLKAAKLADRMTVGDAPLQMLPAGNHDEIGRLNSAFNRLLTKLLENQAKIERLARHDGLTGLPNRFEATERLRQVIGRAQRQDLWFAILFLDLDGFKPINDNLGHEAGDVALTEVARRLQAVVRVDDTLARIGGDEFLIVISELQSARDQAGQAAETVAAKCIDALKMPMTVKGTSHLLGVSIGIALGNGHSGLDELLRAADAAMYRAKAAGRGCFKFAEEPTALLE